MQGIVVSVKTPRTVMKPTSDPMIHARNVSTLT